jgi:hypothetical protein
MTNENRYTTKFEYDGRDDYTGQGDTAEEEKRILLMLPMATSFLPFY